MSDTPPNDLSEISDMDSKGFTNIDEDQDNVEVTETEVTDNLVKRNSINNYRSREAAARELISNGVTSEFEAMEYYDLSSPKVVVKLVEEQDNVWKLIIRDNGVGFSRTRLDKLRSLGETTNGERADRTGQYGIGFYAVFLIAGQNGEVGITSVSRETDEKFQCRWAMYDQAIAEVDEVDYEIEDEFDTEYGAEMSIYINTDTIDPNQLQAWIKKHARAARVPIRFEYSPAKANQEIVTEYEPEDIFEKYDSKESITIEGSKYKAIMSPDAPNELYMLDITFDIEEQFRELPWGVCIRVETENSVVVDAPDRYSDHIGKFKITSDEYDLVDSENREKYVSEAHLTDEHIVSPEPAGTRDDLSNINDFSSYLYDKFDNQLTSQLKNRLDEDNDLSTDDILLIFDMFSDEINPMRELRYFLGRGFYRSNNIKSRLSPYISFNTRIEEATVSKETLNSKRKYGVNRFCAAEIQRLAEENDAEVYTAVTMNEIKQEIAKLKHENVIFVKVSESSDYDTFSVFGWEPLKTISTDPDDHGLSKKEKKYIKKNKSKQSKNDSKSIADTELTIRFGLSGRRNNVQSVTVSELLNDIKSHSNNIRKYTPEKVVLFSDSSDKNISDHYDLGCSRVCLVRCSDEVFEHLLENDSTETLISYENYFEASLDASVQTLSGKMTGEELVNRKPSAFSANIVSREILNEMNPLEYTHSHINEACNESHAYSLSRSSQEILHMFMDSETELKLRPVLHCLANESEEVVASCLYGENIYSRSDVPDWKNFNQKIDLIQFTGILEILRRPDTPLNRELEDFFREGDFSYNGGGITALQILVDRSDNN